MSHIVQIGLTHSVLVYVYIRSTIEAYQVRKENEIDPRNCLESTEIVQELSIFAEKPK